MKKQNLFLTLAIAVVSAITSLHALRVGQLEISPGDSDAYTQAPFFELIKAAWAHDRPYQLAIALSADRPYPFDAEGLSDQFGYNNFNNPLTRKPIESIQIYDITRSTDSEDVEQAAVNINAERTAALNAALVPPVPVAPPAAPPAQLVIPAHVTDISQIMHRFNQETNTLDLANTGITQIDGIVFTQMAQQLPNLQKLLLHHTPLRELPHEIGNLANLQELWLYDTPLTQLPPEIGRLANLQQLLLNETPLRELPHEIDRLVNLRVLNLSYTPLGELPPEIGDLVNLRKLHLSGTQLTQLPPEIGRLANLRELWLNHTPLRKLPHEIGNLTHLQMLWLSGTRLAQLPHEIGGLTHLQMLWLSRTQLTQLPPEIGRLANLRELHLFGTQLTQLPPEIGNLTNLQELWLYDTPLSRRDDWNAICALLHAQLPNTRIYPG